MIRCQLHRRMYKKCLLLFCLFFTRPALADITVDMWDMNSLSRTPNIYPSAETYGVNDLKAIFYEGRPWKGNPTRVFAYYGIPEGASSTNKVPAVVCVHGGGGTAFADWVRIWKNKGYAAIAIDTTGTVPKGSDPDWTRHNWSGPSNNWDQNDIPLKDHWGYHAVADVILANSLLRSMPEIDANNIGLTGISWGGYVACIAAGVDNRFKFVIPVYGCGFLTENSNFTELINKYGKEKWLKFWDPSVYISKINMPNLWITGTNDLYYHLPSFQKSYQSVQKKAVLTVRVRMWHDHPYGWNSPEIYAFADNVTKGKTGLAGITNQGRSNNLVWVDYAEKDEAPVVAAELNYTTDSNEWWPDRYWNTITAQVDMVQKKATVLLPENTTAYYFNLIDKRNLIISSSHIKISN